KKLSAPYEHHHHKHEWNRGPEQFQPQRLLCPLSAAPRPAPVHDGERDDEKDDESGKKCRNADQEPIQGVQFRGECRSLYGKKTETLFHARPTCFVSFQEARKP